MLTRLVPSCVAAAAIITLIPSAPSAQLVFLAPPDLRSSLVTARDEAQLVAERYRLDRQMLHGNYAGADRDAAGLVRIGPATPVVPISRARLARLKRFDLAWQEAVTRLDRVGLSQSARATLDDLGRTIDANLGAIETDASRLAAIAPLMPFGEPLVGLIEARIRLDPVDPGGAARVLTEAAAQIAAARAAIEVRGALPDVARDAASAVRLLRRDLAEWFAFYDGYDPLFSWWVRGTYPRIPESLEEYAVWLERGVPVPRGVHALPPTSSVAPSPAPPFADVPDLRALLALAADEMSENVATFRRGHEVPSRRPEFYRSWLTALESLDFDQLSRNAQVDYLFIRRTSQVQLERAGAALPANPPRKTDASGITGDARGREGLLWDLADEMIPYSPEELVTLAEREFAWVEGELRRAARELGYGDDWKKAIEHVKGLHPPPGGQPRVIREMLLEAVDYLRANKLVSVPQVAVESMQIVMLTPEQQLINPFFRGGPRMSLSYPTDTMTYDQRLQSMRGNNTPFSHATAHHEMIPGHYLDLYMATRHAGYRADLGVPTPFFREGWALYWELLLYERGFNDTPEERVGALFWRLHRCARIIFSLRFHLGQWSPAEAIDFLVERVGHERDNATAEVRRSFGGTYGPLYQAAYLLGGIQIRSLHREIVERGRMTPLAFHDEMLRQGSMPIALHRLTLSGARLTRDMSIEWRFAN